MMFYDTVDADLQYNVKLSVCLFPDSFSSLSLCTSPTWAFEKHEENPRRKKKEQKNK